MLVLSRPAVYDVETVAGTRDLVAAVAPRTPVLCVLNAVPPRGPREGQARALLADFGVAVGASRLGQRAAVDYAAAAGQSASEHDPRGRAAAEIAALWSAVGALTGLTLARPAGAPARRLAADRDTTLQALLGEAVNDLFAKHSLPELTRDDQPCGAVDAPPRRRRAARRGIR